MIGVGVVVALLPVTGQIPLGGSVTCNAAAVREANTEGASTSNLSNYAPAFEVWVHPSIVESPSIGYGDGSNFAGYCESAAQSQMIGVAVLVGIGLLALLIANVALSDADGGVAIPGISSQGLSQAGWYADPTDAQNIRWWDGQSWTDYKQPIQQVQPLPTEPPPQSPGL